MANNITVLDYNSDQQVVKTTDTAGVHTPHHNVDSSALPTGAATSAKQDTIITAVQAIQTAVELLDNMISGTEGQVDVVSSALPTGAATETTLSSIDSTLSGGVTVDLGANNDVTLATLPDTAAGDLAAINSAVSGTVTVNATGSGDVPITLDGEAVVLGAGTAAIGKLVANDGVDIGDVDVTSIAAGTNTIGATLDAGPKQTVTRTYTASADMSTAADISPAPSTDEKIVAMDILVSTDTAMNFSIQEETSATVFAKVFLPDNGSAQITLRGYIKAAVANKKLQGKASVSGNVAVTVISFSEA